MKQRKQGSKNRRKARAEHQWCQDRATPPAPECTKRSGFCRFRSPRPAGLDARSGVWHFYEVKKSRSPRIKSKASSRKTRGTTRKKERPVSRRLQLDFGFKVSVEPGSKAAANHAHQVLEVVYFLSGRGRTTIDKTTYEIRPGNFCVIPPGVIHNQISETTITTICLGLKGSGLEDSLGFWADKTGEIHRCAVRLMEELAVREAGYSMVTEGYLTALVGLAKRAIKANAQPDRRQALIAHAMQIIEDKEGNLSIDDIAGQLFISKDYLRHLFTHYTGHPPIQALLAARIGHAKRILADPSPSISQVAEVCGFDNPYYFSRLFKKVTGVTPMEFRKG
jgi:AraC-like DNA-binding protein/mannose-6-phosphate isomerase-like protein (cupin superfamily)